MLSHQAPLAPIPGVAMARRDTALVACCGNLFFFGGCIQETRLGSDLVASQDLFIIRTRQNPLGVQITLVQTGHDKPGARWGHATFVHGKYIYVFGGMCERREGREIWDVYFNGTFRFDVKSCEWTKVEIFSCTPCPRAHMGVAFDEKRAVVIGGVTAKPDGTKVHLADVWEFDFETCCWIQVVPGTPTELPASVHNKCWISARSGAACSLLDANTLVTLGGVGRNGPMGRDLMTVFTVKRGIAARIAAKAGNPGPHRDAAVTRACTDIAGTKCHLPVLSKWTRALCSAPAGSVNLLAIRSLELVEGAFSPLFKSLPGYMAFLPSDCIFSPEGIQTLRPLGGDPGNPWGSMECPFDLAPRWLNVPREFSINLASASSAVQRAEDPVNLRQTLKQFGTIKAAVEYFKLCRPPVHLSEWERVEVEHESETSKLLRWQVQECVAFAVDDLQGCRQQIYMMAMLGPIFFCFLVTQCPQPKSMSASNFCLLLFKTQVYVISVEAFKVSTYCHHCGEGNDPHLALMDTKSRPKMSTKVCRGCHLVRYCSNECQQADWEAPYGHREVCRKYASQLATRSR
ncbi:probable Tip elongation aberrant protein 1 at N-terminal half [Coccomyxa sp. Obi]|nr:probable Tip elongation aberrant protein 1 at N-terminal half [Coccomyxa sp. Obi]